MDRRTALKLMAAAGSAPALVTPLWAASRFADDPFTLGVASSATRPYAITLWTRLAPSPLEVGGGIDPVPERLAFELAADEGFANVVARGEAVARPELAHSVRVTIDGLEPARPYWYRFMAGDAVSQAARTRTLPAPGDDVARVRFATASCQHFEQGYFGAFERMIEDEPDFCLHLGDYIYGVSRGDFRAHTYKHDPLTLEDFRLRHALYKTDESLQRAHAAFPFFTVLDNHDALKNEPLSPEQMAKKRAAYQAWFEHMPLEGGYVPGGASLINHRSLDLGTLLRLNILDTRQFRDDETVCRELADPDYGFTIYRPVCDPVLEESRTSLGRSQEAWLEDRIATSPANWNALASTVLFSPFAMRHNGDTYRYESSWDYFPANRRRILEALSHANVANPVVLSADVHSNWAIDLTADPDDPESEVIGAELLSTSIASSWPPPLDGPIRENLGNNPHVKHYDGSERGYMLHTLDRGAWTTRMRVIDDVQRADPAIATQATFVVEGGRPGVQRD